MGGLRLRSGIVWIRGGVARAATSEALARSYGAMQCPSRPSRAAWRALRAAPRGRMGGAGRGEPGPRHGTTRS